jgi:hypothetical protein
MENGHGLGVKREITEIGSTARKSYAENEIRKGKTERLPNRYYKARY